MRTLYAFLRNQAGMTIVEYALVGSLISVAALVAFEAIGQRVNSTYPEIASEQQAAEQGRKPASKPTLIPVRTLPGG